MLATMLSPHRWLWTRDMTMTVAGILRTLRARLHRATRIEHRSQNYGSGAQTNVSLSGGAGNTQYSAHIQHIYGILPASGKQTKYKAIQAALLAGMRPDVDRDMLLTAKGQKVEGTCEWIQMDNEYQSLLRGDTRLLWICGGPGKGKTMLSISSRRSLEETSSKSYICFVEQVMINAGLRAT